MFHSMISSKKRKVATISAITLLSFSAFVAIFGGATVPTVLQKSGFNVGTGTHVDLTITLFHKDQHFANFGWLAGQWAKGVYFMPSCIAFCNGITYSVDPSSLAITDCGHDWEQFKVFGSGNDAATCDSGAAYQSADISNFMSVSTSTSLTNTATACTGQYTSNGFSVVAGTITPGAKGTTVTTTETHTWTATGATSALATACIQTEGLAAAHIVLYSIAPFGPDTLANGDTLKITWTIART